jgi:hypothetical protein
MATRQTHYAEALARTTTTNISYQDKTTLTFTPDASSDYWFLWSCILDQSSVTSDAKVRLQDTTGGTTLCEYNCESKDLTDIRSFFGLAKHTSGGSPASNTWKTQFCSESGTTGIAQSTLLALKAATGDQYAESNVESTTTSSTYSTKATLNFTPASQGDYLIIATAEVACDSLSDDIGVRLAHSATNYGDAQIRTADTSSYVPWGTMVKLNLTASSKTFTIDFNSTNNSDIARIRNARILAIRLDTLDNAYYAEARTRATTTNTTYVDAATLTQTPQALEHVIFGCGLLDGSSTTVSGGCQLIQDSTSLGEMFVEANSNGSEFPYMAFYRQTLSAVSTSWKTQYKAESSSNTAGFQESAIAVLQTAATPTPPPAGSLRMRSLLGVGA